MLTAAVVAALACLVWPGGSESPGTPEQVSGNQGRGPRRVVRLRARVSRPAARGAGAAWVADFAEVVAVGLDAGLDLPAAALASARSPGVVELAPWLAARLEASVDAGRGVAPVVEDHSGLGRAEGRDLALLAAAWRLAEEVGAAAAAVTSSAAVSVRERRAAADRTAVVVAGPRASMVLLSALPVAGPAAALLVGLPPDRLYDSTASRLLAAIGLLLTAAGWWWAGGLLRRAGRPGRTEGPPR